MIGIEIIERDENNNPKRFYTDHHVSKVVTLLLNTQIVIAAYKSFTAAWYLFDSQTGKEVAVFDKEYFERNFLINQLNQGINTRVEVSNDYVRVPNRVLFSKCEWNKSYYH